MKKTTIKYFTSITGVIAFFLLYGTVGALETDLINIGHAITRLLFYLSYIIAMQLIYKKANKKAHRCWRTDRANKKHVSYII